MAGSTASTNPEETSRLFDVRLRPHPSPGEWTLRVRQLEPWTTDQHSRWAELIQEGFIHLAAVGGLCGERGLPLSSAFSGDVELWQVDDWFEWRFGVLSIDPRAVSLLLNLCDWGAFHIAPALEVEIQASGLSVAGELADRPLPRRSARLSFSLDDDSQETSSCTIQAEFAQPLTGALVRQISHLLKPWHIALFRWGFALPTLPVGESLVRPDDPPVVIVDNLWNWNFETFAARGEALDVFLNCLERVHHTVCPVKAVAIE